MKAGRSVVRDVRIDFSRVRTGSVSGRTPRFRLPTRGLVPSNRGTGAYLLTERTNSLVNLYGDFSLGGNREDECAGVTTKERAE